MNRRQKFEVRSGDLVCIRQVPITKWRRDWQRGALGIVVNPYDLCWTRQRQLRDGTWTCDRGHIRKTRPEWKAVPYEFEGTTHYAPERVVA